MFYKYFCANSLRSADELRDQSNRNLFDINVNTPIRGNVREGIIYYILYLLPMYRLYHIFMYKSNFKILIQDLKKLVRGYLFPGTLSIQKYRYNFTETHAPPL